MSTVQPQIGCIGNTMGIRRAMEHANSPTATRGGPGIELHIVSHKIGAQEPLFD